MARSTCGSPNTLATPKQSKQATNPAIMPRMRRSLTMMSPFGRLVAGEAEQVAPVMHEFVHVHAGDDRGGAFLDADEIDHRQQEHAEDEPGHDVAHRDGDG